jgi:predicted secreted protein
MKKLLIALVLALLVTVAFATPVSANDTQNWGSYVSDMAKSWPGAVADEVHWAQEYAANMETNLGQLIKVVKAEEGLIPGHNK